MCEASAYMLNEAGEEELWLSDVDKVVPLEEGGWLLTSIFGEQKVLKGQIKSMSLVNHRLLLSSE